MKPFLLGWAVCFAPSAKKSLTVLQSRPVFIPEIEMTKRRQIHSVLCELKEYGFVVEASKLSEDARLLSEFGDPLALGRENTAKVGASLARGVRVASTENIWQNETKEAVISWTSAVLGSAVQGETVARFVDEYVTEIIIKNISLQGLGSTREIASARQFIVSILDSANRYDDMARLVGTRLAGVLPESLSSAGQTKKEKKSVSFLDVPKADALGTPAFESYDILQTAALRLVTHLKSALDKAPESDIYATHFRFYGLADEVLAENFATVDQALTFFRSSRSTLFATGLLRDELYTVTPIAFNGTALSIDFVYEARLGLRENKMKFAAQVLYTLDSTSTDTARLVRVSLNGNELEPSAAQARLAQFAADFLPSTRPLGSSSRRSRTEPLRKGDPVVFPTVSAIDSQALLRATAAIYNFLPQVYDDADAFIDAIGLSEKISIRGLLNERLLSGKNDVRSALRAGKTLARISRQQELKVEHIEIRPDAKLKLTFRIISAGSLSPTFLVTCLLTISDAALSEIAIVDIRPVGGTSSSDRTSNLPARLAAVLQTASDLGRSSSPFSTSSLSSSSSSASE